MQRYWVSHRHSLQWNCLFTLPAWLQAWWETFGASFSPHICAVATRDQLIGIAPLMTRDGTAYLMGSDDVCDYLDFIVAPEKSEPFFEQLLRHLADNGITTLDLHTLRPESAAATTLAPVAQAMGCKVSLTPHDVSVELALPGSWESYLHTLKGKERHEIRRKFRRLENRVRFATRILSSPGDIESNLDHFLHLFLISREDKADFLTTQMRTFFKGITKNLAAEGILKLFILDIEDNASAVSMCFDYGAKMYLYNNGYDPEHHALSIGLLNKILSIQTSIGLNKKTYDFMKGNERYKLRLGGRQIQLQRCRIDLTLS